MIVTTGPLVTPIQKFLVMVWALLYLSAATIGASTILGGFGVPIPTPSTISTVDDKAGGRAVARSFLTLTLMSDSYRILFSGVVLGIGVSLLLSTLNSYFRIAPSIRIFWRFLCNTDETKELFPYRIPTSAADTSKGQQPFVHRKASSSSSTKQEEETKDDTTTSGTRANSTRSSPTTYTQPTVRTLVNPSMAATAHLHVDYIAVAPHFEVPPQKARTLEFYYVISGAGVMSQQGIPERQPLTTGDCCIVDVGHMRWFKNNHNTQPLLLLRATDGPSNPDRIRKDPNHRETATSFTSLDASSTIIANGIRALQATATDYYNKKTT